MLSEVIGPLESALVDRLPLVDVPTNQPFKKPQHDLEVQVDVVGIRLVGEVPDHLLHQQKG